MSRAGTWSAAPNQAWWYGKVIGSRPGEDVDYVYAYSAERGEPDIETLVPDGWVVDESSVRPTPNNPAWEPDGQNEGGLRMSTTGTWSDGEVGPDELKGRRRRATVPAGELSEWTGFLAHVAGEWWTIDAAESGGFTTETKVRLTRLVGADLQRRELNLLKASPVDIYR